MDSITDNGDVSITMEDSDAKWVVNPQILEKVCENIPYLSMMTHFTNFSILFCFYMESSCLSVFYFKEG